MKRRVFLTTSGTVGLAGIVSGASIVSPIYSSISANVLLEEFNPSLRSIFDQFTTNMIQNVEALELDEKIVKRVVTPVRIVKKKFKDNDKSITYKNRSGEYVSISVVNGVGHIDISK